MKRSVHRALDVTHQRTPVETIDLKDARYVILSDTHRGQRDGADDFQKSEQAYLAALEHYWKRDFVLVLLGDAEELWECRPRRALPAYENVLAQERRFNAASRYIRVFGNHDDLWMHQDAVDRHLGPRLGALQVREAMRFRVTARDESLGELFLVHGHQGTWASDKNRGFARWVVRNLWRPIQRVLRVGSTTPAKNECLREKHDIVMYEWTLGHPGVVLIAGHTHRPVWTSRTHVQQMEEALAKLEASRASKAKIAALEKEIRDRRAKDKYCDAEHRKRALTPRPSYFNTGCCCFPDGQLTGLEIEGEHIRLVRWSGGGTAAVREERSVATLPRIFAELRA